MTPTLTNRDLFFRDPTTLGLENNGVAQVGAKGNVLRFELETFVCTGQYAEGLRRILESYIERYARGEQANAWVSGFFGSGKSHLVKMLAALWANTPFPDGRRPRDLVAELPVALRDLLTELDTRTRPDGDLVAVSGTLGSAPHDIPYAVLSLVLASLGYPSTPHHAQFELWLRRQALYEPVRAHIEATGASFETEVRSMYVSPVLHGALREAGVDLGAGAGTVLRAQFPDTKVIPKDAFVLLLKEALTARGNGRLPATLVVLDEVQQSIGDSPDRAFAVQGVAEALSVGFDGRLLLVATGQQALTETPNLSKIAGRFPVKVGLSDTDIEAVTRRVVLRKKPERVAEIDGLFERVAGEVDRHLHGTPFAVRPEDRTTLAADYPILPVRRRFWEALLRVFEGQGTTGQLRSQLRLVHDAARGVAADPLGVIVGADFLYESIEGELRNAGQVPREHLDEIVRLRGGSAEDRLRARTCALVYLIGKLHEVDPGKGLLATPDVLADLLVTDLNEGSAALRRSMPERLAALAEKGLLAEIDGAYRLQTRAGGEWEREFSRRRGTYATAQRQLVQIERDTLLFTAASDLARSIKLTQGSSKTPRELVTHRGMESPPEGGARISVWVRSGWEIAEDEALAETRQLGTESPVVVVYLPSLGRDLEPVLRDRMAAADTIAAKGTVTSPEETTARAAMESRRNTADTESKIQARAILDGARVWIAGGEEVTGDARDAALRDAAQRSLVRLFPRFDDADHTGWEKVLPAVRKGSGDALASVGHNGEAMDHVVVRALSDRLGKATRGQELREAFRASPFGWSDDALNGALAVLVQNGLVRAEQDGQAVAAKDLDAKRIGTATFRRESVTLPAAVRLQLRKKLGKALGAPVNSSPADEAEAAQRFVAALRSARDAAGGEAPAPTCPDAGPLLALEGRSGNDLLAALTDHAFESLDAWREQARSVAARLPAFETASRLAAHAADLDAARDARSGLDAVRADRRLLGDPDPVAPLRQALTAALHADGARLDAEATRAHDDGEAILAASEAWATLSPERQQAMRANHLSAAPTPVPSDERALLDALDRHDLGRRGLVPDSVRASYRRMIDEAVREAAPSAVRVAAPSALLRSEAEVDAYLDGLRQSILDALARGPVQL